MVARFRCGCAVRLEIDQGNTRIKWRLIAAVSAVASGVVLNQELAPGLIDDIRAALPHNETITRCYVASVAKPEFKEPLISAIGAQFSVPVTKVASEVRRQVGDVLVINGYENPTAMGVDRWLAVLGAVRRYPGRALVVADFGSAVNVEVVGPGGEYLGGYIAPGAAMMQRMLLKNTGQVVFEGAEKAIMTPGTNTGSAVANGVYAAAVGLVERVVGFADLQWGRAEVDLVVTGGDAAIFVAAMPRAVYCPDLVLDGLSEIAEDVGLG